MNKLILSFALLALVSCTSKNNNTVAGTAIGGVWGAGAGAVVGNQLSPARAGEGMAVGMGLGMISGAAQGAGFDATENAIDEQYDQLEYLTSANQANRLMIKNIQARLDNQNQASTTSLVYQVFFDSDATNIKYGAIKNLEQVADQIVSSSRVAKVIVEGHSDDTGNKEYNEKLSEARAKSVAAYLMGRGLSQDQVQLVSLGATHPVATNRTAEGRQLNRRVDIAILQN